MRPSHDDVRAVLGALGSGVGTAAWYALPDHVASRRQRALIKAGLAGALLGWSLVTGPPLRPGAGEALGGGPHEGLREGLREGPGEGRGEGPGEGLGDGPAEPTWWDRSGPVAHAAVLLGGVGATAAVAVLGERVLFRLAQRSARRGATLPHTRNGVVLGVLGALVAFGADRAARRWPAPPQRADGAVGPG